MLRLSNLRGAFLAGAVDGALLAVSVLGFCASFLGFFFSAGAGAAERFDPKSGDLFGVGELDVLGDGVVF